MANHRTILYEDHLRLGARIVDFHGWELPVQYESILAEHTHCRRAACVFDTSHMGQILIRSRPEGLAHVTTQDAAALPIGRGRYGFLLNPEGGILDDTILMRLGEDEFLLVVNAGPAAGDFEWVRRHLPTRAVATLQSAAGWGKIDLQGPASAETLAPLTEAPLRYFSVTRTRVCDQPCIVSRTGYTGELGYELFAPGDAVLAIFRALAADPRVRPAGLGARDSLRLEASLPLYGDDIDASTNPIEAGLGGFVDLNRDFLGAQALRAVAAAGPTRLLVAFAAKGRQRAWHGDAITSADGRTGVVTSAAFAPSLGVAIGMGYVPPDLAAPGTELTVKTRRGDLPATVAEKPLYKKGTCRMRL